MRVLTIFILFFLLAGNNSCQAKKEYYEDYLIPEGYVGYVRVLHKVQDAPPLPVENGRYIYKFDESGLLKTQTPVLAGWSYAKYYYYTDTSRTLLPDTASGGGGMIWDGTIIATTILQFFVGTEHQQSLWYQSDCGKEKDRFGYLPQNIKQCLDDYEKSKATKK